MYRIKFKYLLSIFLLLTSLQSKADDFTLVGQVLDDANGFGLTGVSVYFPESGLGVQTDETGFFFIKGNGKEHSLLVSCVGYKTRKIRIKPGLTRSIQVRLQEDITELGDLFVLPGVNIAEKQIMLVAVNRWRNDPMSGKNVAFGLYSEDLVLLFHALGSGKSDLLFSQFDKHGLDTVNDQLVNPLYISRQKFNYRTGNEKQLVWQESKSVPKEIDKLMEKMTGQMPEMINFYEPYPVLLGKSFISPFSSSSHLFYRYVLKDSLLIDGRKSYHIRFKSLNPRNLAFDGDCLVDSADNALREVNAVLPASANLNFIRDIELHALYSHTDRWMPATESWQYKLKNSFLPDSMRTGPSLLMLKKISFTLQDSLPALPATRFADSHYGETDLNAKLDEMSKMPMMKAASWIADATLTGYMNLGKLDLGRLYQLGRYSQQEGLKLNIPLRTNEKLWKNVSLGGYMGYGFGNRKFSYGLESVIRFPLKSKTLFGFRLSNDYRRINYDVNNDFLRENPHVSGNSDFFNTIIGMKIAGSLYPYKEAELFLSGDLTKDIETRFTYRNTRMMANQVLDMHRFSEVFPTLDRQSLTLTTRISFDEKTYEDHLNRIYVRNFSPILYITLEGGQYSYSDLSSYYSKIKTSVRQRLLFGWGQWDYLIEGGYTLGQVPWPMMHMPQYNEYELFGKYRFSLMNPMEYLASRYVNLHNEWVFNGILMNYIPLINELKLREVLSLKTYYGIIDQQSADLMDLPVPVVNNSIPYVEVGAGVTNLFKILSLQTFWRLTDPHKEGVKSWRFSVALRLNF